MAQKNNAICSICGNEYYVCMSCKDSMKTNPWKMYTDTAEHYKVYQIIRGLSTGVYTKDEAKARLKNVDLRDLNNFRPHIKKIIKDTLKEEKVIETSTNDESSITEVSTEESPIVEKTIISRKRSYKMEAE